MSKIVFITGATSGIGKACAYKFAQGGYSLLLNGRKPELLEELKNELEKQYAVDVIGRAHV